MVFGPSNRPKKIRTNGCWVLTSRRILLIPTATAKSIPQSIPIQDLATAVVEEKSRYTGLFLPAVVLFILGVAIEISLTMAGRFSTKLLIADFLFIGGPLVAWWYFGGGATIRIVTNDFQTEGSVARQRGREATEFVNKLIGLKVH
ncbi:MAG: hypothetical protein H8E48_08130 [Chloroflexi bacterium]|nr:hypothetical protein [Chloroflexota bacterium]